MNDFQNWLKGSINTLEDAVKESAGEDRKMLKDRLYIFNLIYGKYLNSINKGREVY
jgi:hypothetical protein